MYVPACLPHLEVAGTELSKSSGERYIDLLPFFIGCGNGYGRKPQIVRQENQRLLTRIRLVTNMFYASTNSGAPEKTVSYAYDVYGRMTSYSDGITAGALIYDDTNRTRTVTTTYASFTNVCEYKYDVYGRMNTLIYGQRTNTYSYDSDGRLVGIGISGQGTATYAYDTLGRRVGVNLPGGTVAGFTHDNFGAMITNKLADSAGNDILKESFVRNNLGNIVSKQTEAVDHAYNYDNIDQLVGYVANYHTAVTGSTNITYQYDPMGNLLQRSTLSNDGGATNLYAANNLNQYTSVVSSLSSVVPLYDLNGNLTNDGVQAYNWDIQDRLISVIPLNPTNGSLKCEFAYDYMSRRVGKKVYTYDSDSWTLSSDSFFAYDGWNIIAEISHTPTPPYSVTNYYVWGLDLSGSLQGAGGVGGLLVATLNGTNYLPAYDGNGNILTLVNSSDGSTVASYEYSPFGECIKATGSLALENKFRFSTKYSDDETGLIYYGYRYYDTKNGRWVSRDPLYNNEANIPSYVDQGTLYAFVSGNPINRVDSLGLFSFEWVGDFPQAGYIAVSVAGVKSDQAIIAKLSIYTKHKLCGSDYDPPQRHIMFTYSVANPRYSFGNEQRPYIVLRLGKGVEMCHYTLLHLTIDAKLVSKGVPADFAFRNDASFGSESQHAPTALGMSNWDKITSIERHSLTIDATLDGCGSSPLFHYVDYPELFGGPNRAEDGIPRGVDSIH